MLFDLIANALFPPVCVACGRRIEAGAACATCFGAISVNNSFACGAGGAAAHSTVQFRHPAFPCLIGGAASYEDPAVRELIRSLKFKSISAAAEPLGDLIFAFTHRTGFDAAPYDYLLPIPLSARRRRTRGYNQADLIARRFARRITEAGRRPPPIAPPNLLVRTRNTRPQSGLANETDRQANVRGAFGVPDAVIVQGRSFILIDDVATSGSTIAAAADALRAAGATDIVALAAAKA